MSFVKEVKKRWGEPIPAFFVKVQLILGAVGATGAALVLVPVPEEWSIINKVGPMLIAGAAIGAAVAQLVVKVTTILAPGETLTNDTGSPVMISTDVTPKEASEGLTVTKADDK